MKIMTYREWYDWQLSQMSRGIRLLYRMGNPPNWSHYYLKYVLRNILKANSLREAKKNARIALGTKEG